MTQAVTYERETKSVAFQGKIIVLESLTPVLLSLIHIDVYKRQKCTGSHASWRYCPYYMGAHSCYVSDFYF